MELKRAQADLQEAKAKYEQALTRAAKRLAATLVKFCTKKPPQDQCVGWLRNETDGATQDNRLQEWVLTHARPAFGMYQGIGLIEAAQNLMDCVQDGIEDDDESW
jgi:hypothetical protein